MTTRRIIVTALAALAVLLVLAWVTSCAVSSGGGADVTPPQTVTAP